MTKIVVNPTLDLNDSHRQRLNRLGDVTYFETVASNIEDYLARLNGVDIVCSDLAGLKDAYPYLRDVYVTVPFVSVAFLDLNILSKNNVTISNAPGVNKHAVSEWIMAMTILLTRDLYTVINRQETYRKDGKFPPFAQGLAGNKMTILGKGNVGERVGKLAEDFGMQVSYFRRGDDLYDSVRNADVVVDTLGSNPSTHRLLDAKFFQSMKRGSYFVSVTRSEITDEDAMLQALDAGHLAGVATDCGGILVGDTNDPLYQKFLAHPKVLATPHIAYSTQMSMQMGADIMIDNVEAWINGKPQNVLN